MTPPSTLDDARAALRQHFGYPEFRPGQTQAVESVLQGQDTLVVLPTGGGKSICYQVPALMLPKLTVVISPLISLMKDQVDTLVGNGVPAALYNSSLSPDEKDGVVAGLRAGRYCLLYVSPERLALAKEFGADAVVNSKDTDPVKAVHDLTHGDGAETTMDCTGVPEARVAAVRSAGTWGRVALVGEGGGPTAFDISQHLLRRQLTIHASWTFSAMGQAECARFIVDKKVPLKKLLTHRFKLDEADRAYKLFDTQTTGKGVFVF